MHCRNRLAGVSSGLSDGKLHLVGTSLHLCLERHIMHRFIGGGTQLPLTLGHATNIARRGLGGDNFFFCPLAGQICPSVRALVCIGQRAVPGLFPAGTALTGGASNFDLFCIAVLTIFFYLLAGKLLTLPHGEIGILFYR